MSDLGPASATAPGYPRRLQLALALAVVLVILTAYVSWFDYAALTAVFHPGRDAAGNLQFRVPGYTNTVYPFTYAAVATSFLGVSWFVFSQERGRLPRVPALLLAVLVANLASIGMIDVYEQLFVTLMFYSPGLHTYGVYGFQLYWGSAGAAAGTAGGLLIALTVVPWARRENWPGVLLCLGLGAVAFGVWFASGFATPSSGGELAYGLNAVSRVAFQLAVVAAVSSKDWLWMLAHSVRALARRPAGASTRGSAAAPTTPRP